MNNKISNALSKQLSWIRTWKNQKGAYNGYVVHRFNLKRMFRIHDTPWSQGPIINGYLNLYETTSNKKWLEEAIIAAELQCNRIQETGQYNYAGFEDDRFSSLVHNSLANNALLDLANLLTNEGKEHLAKKYIDIAKKNIDLYLLKNLWDEKFGAFKFNKIDYYSPKVDRFVTNMNSVAVESLIKLSNLSKEDNYNQYALRVGEWILNEQIISNGIEDGGINYENYYEPNQSTVLVSIYTALSMRGLDDLYILTDDSRYLEMMEKAANHLIQIKDHNTKLFYQLILDGKIIKYPQFIAGSGIILKALDDTEKISKAKYEYGDTLKTLLNKQLPNGGFPNFIGYFGSYIHNSDHFEEVWEDIVPIMGWNAHLFEFLTRKIGKNYEFPLKKKELPKKNNNILKKNYYYGENNLCIFILGFWPIRSMIIYFSIKKIGTSILYISTKQIEFDVLYSFLRHK